MSWKRLQDIIWTWRYGNKPRPPWLSAVGVLIWESIVVREALEMPQWYYLSTKLLYGLVLSFLLWFPQYVAALYRGSGR